MKVSPGYISSDYNATQKQHIYSRRRGLIITDNLETQLFSCLFLLRSNVVSPSHRGTADPRRQPFLWTHPTYLPQVKSFTQPNIYAPLETPADYANLIECY